MENYLFYRGDDSDSDDDYDDIYQGLKFGRQKPLETVEVRTFLIPLLCYKRQFILYENFLFTSHIKLLFFCSSKCQSPGLRTT